MITLDAYASWMAASSAAIERTWASTGPPMATALSPVPNPPTMMLASDRFIASAISLVRMLPDAPTSAPAMISAQFPMTKPAIATAVPVNAFSSEITTGMSAPPIGSTIITPNASDASTTISSAGRLARGEHERGRADRDDGEGHVEQAAALEDDRLAADQALQLARRDDRPGERHRADEHVEHA